MKLLKTLAAGIIALVAVFGLTGCAPEEMNPQDYAAIIDVRTPEEWEFRPPGRCSSYGYC